MGPSEELVKETKRGRLSPKGSNLGGDWNNESVGTPLNVTRPLLGPETPKVPGETGSVMTLDEMKCLQESEKSVGGDTEN